MRTIEVQTGYGYLLDADGKVFAKCVLPSGTHPLSDGYTYVEVSSQAALDGIETEADRP